MNKNANRPCVLFQHRGAVRRPIKSSHLPLQILNISLRQEHPKSYLVVFIFDNKKLMKEKHYVMQRIRRQFFEKSKKVINFFITWLRNMKRHHSNNQYQECHSMSHQHWKYNNSCGFYFANGLESLDELDKQLSARSLATLIVKYSGNLTAPAPLIESTVPCLH